MKNAVIVDIDGTLANIDHRTHYVRNGKKNWKQFFDEMVHDTPVQEVIDVSNKLSEDYTIILCSGRPETHRTQTEEWLAKYGVKYSELNMRPANDYRQDTLIKQQMLDYIRETYDVAFAIDDRPSVVEMWRDNDVFVFDVNTRGDWDSPKVTSVKKAVLTLPIGTSGAGKSTWIKDKLADDDAVISPDELRLQLTGDMKDQSKNNEVFQLAYKLAKDYLDAGVDVIFDATNIRNKERKKLVELSDNVETVYYVVIDRPMKEKIRTGGWRNTVYHGGGLTLMEYHQRTFDSNIKDILNGDGYDHVEVLDLR